MSIYDPHDDYVQEDHYCPWCEGVIDPESGVCNYCDEMIKAEEERLRQD